ncbi:unnamed protein product [Urochloa humidicola]
MVSQASMAAALDDVGRASNLLQLLGVDAFGLVSMITQAALTARQNRDLCLQLAEHGRVVAGLLGMLLQRVPQLRRHPETRRPLDQLDDALRRAYLLVRSCGQELELRSYLYRLLTGAQTAAKLRAAEEEIDRYIRLIPMIGLVAANRDRSTDDMLDEEDGEDYSALPQRDDVATLVDTETQLHEVAPTQFHDALPQESVVTAMADNLRELRIREARSHVFSSEVQAVHAAEARASTSGTKSRRNKKKKNWRVIRVSPQPIIKKARRRKDIICYVCVVPQNVPGRCCNNGEGPSEGSVNLCR